MHQIKRTQPAKKFTFEDLVRIAQNLKKKCMITSKRMIDICCTLWVLRFHIFNFKLIHIILNELHLFVNYAGA